MGKMVKFVKKLFRKIYFMSPRTIQNFMSFLLIRIYSPLYVHGLTYPYMRIVLIYNKFRFRRNFKKYQIKRLRKLLKYVYKNVPYYKQAFDENGINYKEIKCFKDLEKLPILKRYDFQKKFELFKSKRINMKKTKEVATSGTQGIPVKLLMDKKTHASEYIRWVDTIKNTGNKLTDWYLTVPDYYFVSEKNKKPYKINHFFRKIQFSYVANTDEDFKMFIDLIKEYNVKFVACMPSMMYSIALYAEKNNVNVRLGTLISNRENLYEFQRKKIINVFKCKIFNQYTSLENVIGGLKYPEKEGFYCDDFVGIFEICDVNSKQLTENKVGKVITTCLINYAMPLIRYELGDLAYYKKTKDSYSGTVLGGIMGRSSEIIIIGGKEVYPVVLSAVVDYCDIKEAQFLYNKNTIVMKIVKNKPFSSDNNRKAISMLRSIVGKKPKIRLEFVKSIPKGPGGKYCPVKKLAV